MQTDDLTKKAANLAKAAPNEWREFLKAFGEHVDYHRNNIVNSTLPELPTHQGRAQSLTSLQKLFNECLAVNEKLRNK